MQVFAKLFSKSGAKLSFKKAGLFSKSENDFGICIDLRACI